MFSFMIIYHYNRFCSLLIFHMVSVWQRSYWISRVWRSSLLHNRRVSLQVYCKWLMFDVGDETISNLVTCVLFHVYIDRARMKMETPFPFLKDILLFLPSKRVLCTMFGSFSRVVCFYLVEATSFFPPWLVDLKG